MAEHPSPVVQEVEQLRDLCLLPDAEQLELIRDAVPGRDAAAAVQIEEKRGRGRPPGSLNKRNAKFRDQIIALGGHPALALVRAYSTPVEALAAKLGCTKLEAAQLGVRAAAELLPYVEGKQPVQVEISRRSDVVLVMAGGGVSGETVDAIAEEVNDASDSGIDWELAEIGDVLPSLSGEPLRDVSQSTGPQSAD
jgi:hypothetical protein